MNVGFYVPRISWIKIYGPLIDFFLVKKWGVFIFCDYRISLSDLGYKKSQFPAVEDIPAFMGKPDVVAFEDTGDLARTIKDNDIRVFFVVNFNSIAGEVKKILSEMRYSLLVAELQHFTELVEFGYGERFSGVDIVYTYSETWMKWWQDYLVYANLIDNSSKTQVFDEIKKKTVPVGVPGVDQVKNFDDKAIRSKYGIPENKKVVLLLPFPWYGHGFSLDSQWNLWTHMVYKPQPIFTKISKLLRHRSSWKYLPKVLPDMWKGLNDRETINAIRTFCNRNDALFVVKAREKNPIPDYLDKTADFVFFDSSFYPFTTLELLFVTALSIGYLTSTVLESALAGTPSLSLVPGYGGLWPVDSDCFFSGDFSSEPGNFFNFDGVVYSESIADIVLNMSGKTFEDYKLDPVNGDKFIKKYLGYSDYRACERIYNDLCRRLGVEA